MLPKTESRCSPHAQPKRQYEGFLRLLPAIALHARVSFRHLRPEAREEVVQETIANALVAYARLVELGKEKIAYGGPLASYAVAQVKDGRRVGGRLNSNDVMSDQCQRKKGARVTSLDDGQGWEQIVVEDRRSTPADTAAMRIDFREWLKSLSRRRRKIALALARGETSKQVAKMFGVTAGRVSQIRRELQTAWLAFHGESMTA